ncbi:MAG: flagellar hook-associated protein 2 [Desulfotalea sp.]|nr:MAG: flagellar hook-associated protein 2 [Desulfotalea sp.]
MSITFSGLATGLDTDAIVSGLMAIEKAPLNRIQARKTADKQRLDAFAQFKTKLDELKATVGDMTLTSQVRSTKVSLSSEDVFSASTTSGAVGKYDISVAQLSQVQKNISDGFSSKTESTFGTGSIEINGKTISVTAENNSVTGLVQAINEESETTGVHATIINSGKEGPYRIVFTGKDANTSFTLKSTLTGASGNPEHNFNNTQEVQSAQQAIVFIDGIKVTSDSNTISDAINGVSISLNSVSETSHAGTSEVDVDPWDWADPPVYTTNQMNIEPDTGALKEKITAFVTSYNDIMDWINSGYEEFGGSSEVTEKNESDEDDPTLGSVLRGDSTINTIKRQLQTMLTDTVENNGGFRILSEIGIATNRNGTLSQNNKKLDTALEGNFNNIVSLLSGDDEADGVMKKFNSLLLKMTSSTMGMYATQKKSYESSLGDYDRQIDQMELRLSKRELSLRKQFTAMEQLVSSLNAQGDFLTQQMNALYKDR